MALRTAVCVTARVACVIFLLSAASVPAVAAFDGARFDHHATDSPDQRTSDELLSRSSQPTTRAISSIDAERSLQMDGGERLERAVRWGVQYVSTFDEVLPTLGFVLGYSRYDGSDPLTNERRADIYEMITESPGIYVSKLSDETSVHRSTVRYHVRVLETEGLITENVLHGKHRLYPVEETDLSLVAALHDDATAAVLRAVMRTEPASVSLLATDLDRAPSTVSYHLARLAEEGLIVRERDGNTVLTRLPQHVRDVLQSAETALDSRSEPSNRRADS